jgi:D-3-phosphoglycerate dehydrogenase
VGIQVFNILVSDAINEDGLEPLTNNPDFRIYKNSIEEVSTLDQIDALLVRSATNVTSDLLEKMPNLKIIARAGVGVDNIDVPAATKKGIIVVNAPDGNTTSTAEHTFAMVCSLLRKIPQANQSIKNENWERSKFVGTELNGKTLGIVGFGRIGTEIAKRAKSFEMKILAYDPFLTKARAESLKVQSTSLEEIITNSDIITVHTPLNKDTKGLLGFETIKKMKKGVFLINCARGGIIDEEALYHFLDTGHVAGAALDVFVEEPTKNYKLLSHPNVIATPHIAASTKEAQINVALQVASEVHDFLSGKLIKNSINLPSVSHEVFQQIEPYYNLMKSFGKFISQCIKLPVKDIQIGYSGDITDLETTFLTRSLLSGFLSQRVDFPVNDVNAPIITKERGITYGENFAKDTNGYSNLIEVNVTTENSSFSAKATYIKGYGPRIISINEFEVEFNPKGILLYIQHIDQPGVIGKVGNILGELKINIATMHVGRKEAGGEAIMMLSFDQPITEDVIKVFQADKEILSITNIDL